MAAAILKAHGIKSVAARMMGCDWTTVNKFCKEYKSCEKALQIARHEVVDLAESKLLQKLNAGDNWAIGKILDNLGRDRGWGSPKGTEEDPLTITFRTVNAPKGDGDA